MSSCDLPAVEALNASLETVHPSPPGGLRPSSTSDERVAAAAAGWAKLCPADAVLAGQIAQIATARPESWWLVELQTGVVDAYGWTRACTGGSLALSMATKLDPSQRRPYLWKECGLDTLGVFTAAEWNEATGLLILPLVAHKALLDGFVPKEKARTIARALAGL